MRLLRCFAQLNQKIAEHHPGGAAIDGTVKPLSRSCARSEGRPNKAWAFRPRQTRRRMLKPRSGVRCVAFVRSPLRGFAKSGVITIRGLSPTTLFGCRCAASGRSPNERAPRCKYRTDAQYGNRVHGRLSVDRRRLNVRLSKFWISIDPGRCDMSSGD